MEEWVPLGQSSQVQNPKTPWTMTVTRELERDADVTLHDVYSWVDLYDVKLGTGRSRPVLSSCSSAVHM